MNVEIEQEPLFTQVHPFIPSPTTGKTASAWLAAFLSHKEAPKFMSKSHTITLLPEHNF